MTTVNKIENSKNQAENGTKIIKRAHFQGDFRKHTTLKIYICPDNPNQTGEKFLALLELINRESSTIEAVEFIDTSYLYRHYDDQFATPGTSKWHNEHKTLLETSLRVPYKVTFWDERISTSAFQERHNEVLKAYKNNLVDLKTIVDKLANHYARLYNQAASLDYVLEELAKFLTQSGGITSAGNLNAALCWGQRNYSLEIS